MKTFVHVHVYYPELWPELAAAIRNICGAIDLYVTMVKEGPALQQSILSEFPQAKILLVPNIGWDILPFLKVLKQVNLSQYDYLVKLHTKRSAPVFFDNKNFPHIVRYRKKNSLYMGGDRWRKLLLRPLSSRERFEQCLHAFEQDQKLGMIADSHLFLDRKRDTDDAAYDEAAVFLEKNGYPVRQFQFVAGTMFIAKAEIFTALQKIDFRDDMFDVPKDHESRTFAHVMERVLGGIVVAQGYEIRDVFPARSFFYDFLLTCFLRVAVFCFQMRETSSGYRIVKIFKIPVWHRKIR